jgi:hypothetical protein
MKRDCEHSTIVNWKKSEMPVLEKWTKQTKAAGHSITWKIKDLIAKDIK